MARRGDERATKGAVRRGEAAFWVPASGGASRFVGCPRDGRVGGGSSSLPWWCAGVGVVRGACRLQRAPEAYRGRSWAALEPTHLRNDRRDREARLTVVRQQRVCARGALQERSDRRVGASEGRHRTAKRSLCGSVSAQRGSAAKKPPGSRVFLIWPKASTSPAGASSAAAEAEPKAAEKN